MDDDELCPYCAGSGEGMYDGSRCSSCGGSGVARDYDAEEEARCDRADHYNDWRDNDK